MEQSRDYFLLSTDKSLLQLDRIHRFLSEEAYWCEGIPIETVRKAISNSLCFGVYDRSADKLLQVGFARVVTDSATFAWICDVYVEKEYRGQGLSKWLIEGVKHFPDLQNLRRICLTTKDAHGLYRQIGLEITKTPEYWMEIKNNRIYE